MSSIVNDGNEIDLQARVCALRTVVGHLVVAVNAISPGAGAGIAENCRKLESSLVDLGDIAEPAIMAHRELAEMIEALVAEN